MNDIAVALGGGGAKGPAHIGVLRVLEREGFNIRAVAGTSAGGLWGSFYAAGHSPDEIEEMMLAADRSGLYQRREGDGPAFLGISGLHRLLYETLGDTTFEELRLPFGVTAVELYSAQPVDIVEGGVVEAVLATIAVPGVFPPVNRNGYQLIDGGVMNPVPVALARRLAPGLPVVAVALTPPLNGWDPSHPPRVLSSLPFVSNYIGRLRLAQAMNIFLRSVDIGGAALTELRLQLDRPEVIVRPAVPQLSLLDQVDIPALIRLGEEAAEAALPELRRAVRWQRRLERWVRITWGTARGRETGDGA